MLQTGSRFSNAVSESRDDRLEALYALAITTGMRQAGMRQAGIRQGELLGIRKQDVDLEAGSVEVRRTLASIKGGVAVYKELKGGRGRNIALWNRDIEALRRHRATQNEERLSLGSLWEDHDLVFSDPWGRPIHPGG